MKQWIKKYRYTIIFILCIAASVILCLDMAFKTKTPENDNVPQDIPYEDNGREYKYEPDGSDESVILNETDIKKMIVKELPSDFPLKGIGITLKESKKAYVTGTVSREELQTYIEKSGATLDSYMEMMLSLLPDTFNVKAEFDIGTSKDGGLLMLTPKSIDAAGVDLPDGILPQEFFDGLNESINRSLVNNGYYFQSIRVKNGSVELIP